MPTTTVLQRRRFERMATEHAALIGSRIREAREAAGLTQSALAAEIPGKSDGTQVSKWERGEHRVSDDTLKHIAHALGRDVAWFHSAPPDKAETPDPFSVNGELSQLDRIELELADIKQMLAESSEAAAKTLADVLARLQAAAASTRTKAPGRQGSQKAASQQEPS